MSDDFDNWVEKVSRWKDETNHLPVLVREDIIKSKLEIEDPSRAPKAFFSDPLSLQYSMGYKDRRYSLSYDVLRRMAGTVAPVNAVLQTRCNQVAAFSSPYRMTKSLGYIIKHKDPGHLTTKGEREFIQYLERFIYNCGADEQNPYSIVRRDSFDSFLRKLVRDSLQYDQACAEVVPDKSGQPFEFLAVDAATMRLVADSPENLGFGMNAISPELAGSEPYKTLRLGSFKDPKTRPKYAQVINGQIRNVFNHDEMIFGIRNPRTDIYMQGYGYSELEQLISIVTAYLYAEQYNTKYFSQGSSIKGILNFKGDAMSPEHLEGFKRQWKANAEGIGNAWRTPIIQAEQGVDWINLDRSNRDMEYAQWVEFLIKMSCACYLIDPAEIGFPSQGGVSQTPLFESSSEWKLKASRDKGLKPLLKFLSHLINKHIIEKLDDHFVFDFAGLEELTELEKHELRKEQVASYMTLNEIRRAEDLPDVQDGDVVLNPVYLQAVQMRTAQEQQEQQAAAQPPATAAPTAPQQAAPNGNTESPATEDDETSPFADTFGKSLKADKYLEFDLDDWPALVE